MSRSHLSILLVGSALAMSAHSCLAEAVQNDAPPLKLVFFHPSRPGILTQCKEALSLPNEVTLKSSEEAWPVDFAFNLHWPGGAFQHDGPMPESSNNLGTHPTTDVCFALLAGGKPFMSGAVVRYMSTRRLDFPTLVRMRTQPGEPARYELNPSYRATR